MLSAAHLSPADWPLRLKDGGDMSIEGILISAVAGLTKKCI